MTAGPEHWAAIAARLTPHFRRSTTMTTETDDPLTGRALDVSADATGWHVGRSWTGHPLEDICPCPQEPCGLIDSAKASPDCDQHPWRRAKSMRQGHRAEDCPGGAA